MSGSLIDDTAGATPRFQLQDLADDGEHTLALTGEVDRMLAQLESDAVGEAGGRPRDDIALLAVRPGEDPHRSDG